MGVRGFLISCAMRRATSPQAAMRWADTRSVTSSKATTKPSTPPSAPCRSLIRTSKLSSLPRRDRRTSSCKAAPVSVCNLAKSAANSGTTWPSVISAAGSVGRSNMRIPARLTNSTRPAASSPITPAVMLDKTESNSRLRPSVWLWPEINASRWPFNWRVI